MADEGEEGKVCLSYLYRDSGPAPNMHLSVIALVMHDGAGGQHLFNGGCHWPAQCGSGRLEEGRNMLVQNFLDHTAAEWMLMVDDDMGFDPDIIERFLQVADPDHTPIVGGLAFSQMLIGQGPAFAGRFRVQPTIYEFAENTDEEVGFQAVNNYPADTLIPCAGSGAACLFMHRTALQRIRESYGDVWFDRVTHPTGTKFSEDLSFCVRVAGAGIQFHVHSGIKTSHHKECYLDEDWFIRNQPDQLKTPRFVIAGTGRSGSGYIAQVLTAAGVRCGHENWWSLHTQWTPGLVGDSSWLATPVLGSYSGRIYHQIRHPLRCVSSMASGELFEDRAGRWYKVRIRHFEPTGDNLTDSLRCYVAFFDMAETHAERTWRLEDVDADLVMSVAKENDVDISPEDAQAAIDTVPTDWNKHADTLSLTLGDLPDCPEKARLVEIAETYGYDLE